MTRRKTKMMRVDMGLDIEIERLRKGLREERGVDINAVDLTILAGRMVKVLRPEDLTLKIGKKRILRRINE
jgi:hypothetical protein